MPTETCSLFYCPKPGATSTSTARHLDTMTYDRRRHASQYANISPVSDQQELPAIPVPVSAATYSPTEGWDYYQEDGETRIHEPTVEPVVGSHPGGQQYQHSRPPGSQYPQTATNPEAWIQDESPSSNEPSEWNHQNNEPYCLAGHGAYPSVEIRRNQESVGPHDKSREGYIDGNREGQSGGGDENEGRVTALYHTVEGWIYRGDEPRHWSDPALQQTAGEVPYMPDVPASRPNPNQLFPDPIGIEWAPAGSRSTIVYDLSALQPPSHLNTPYMQDYTEEYPLGTHVSAGATRNQPGFEAEPVYPAYPITIQPHPRDNIARWKWKTLLGVGNLLMLINGYDISNVASLQALLYDAFGHVELLPWIGLTYFLCDLAMTPLARKLFQFYEVKFLTILSLLVMISGTALAAAAPNLDCFIAGRALMGFGTALSYQGLNFYYRFLVSP
ncbi:hypothetical protein F5Y15DRAFT_354002 [Xylariaceae sp. FL0016]|nr:hypothetical protein F5Y15DRAFT_354002 [Xylariaceae sp. FL0016]